MAPQSSISSMCRFYGIQPLKVLPRSFQKLIDFPKRHYKIIAPFTKWEISFFKRRIKIKFEEEWDDLFDIKIGPFGMGAYFGPRPFKVRYSRTSNSHLLRFQINRDVKKEEIKVRLVELGIIEVEWPRKINGEEIPVE